MANCILPQEWKILFLIFYLFAREKEKKRVPIHWLTPQMSTTAGPGSGGSQNPGTQSSRPAGQQSRDWSHHLLPPRVWINRKPDLRVELGLQLRPWDLGCRCSKRCFNHCTKCVHLVAGFLITGMEQVMGESLSHAAFQSQQK